MQGSEKSDTRKIVYKLSWLGNDGHPGTLIIEQGSLVSILPANPSKDSKKADLIVVKFTSFSAKNPVGIMRCQANGKQLEIYPNQLGSRLIRAQMLAVEAEQPGAAHVGDASSEQPRQSRRQRQAPVRFAAESTSEAAVATAANDEANALRRQRDAVHRAACEKLQGNEHWVKVVEERVEKQKGDSIMVFQQLQLTKAADCADFGKEEYGMLQAAGFTRCLACLKILTCLSAGEKHRCRPPDQSVQPKGRPARAEPALQGNIQLDTALIAEVTTGFSHASWMGVLIILVELLQMRSALPALLFLQKAHCFGTGNPRWES